MEIEQSNKPQLVLVQPFPANHLLAAGIIEYLSLHFNVNFIDLPGFYSEIAPLPKNSIQEFAKFVENKITSEVKGSYILGGISFGSLVVSKMQVDQSRCRAILNAEPFYGHNYLRISPIKKRFLNTLISTIVNKSAYEKVWSNDVFLDLMKSQLGRDSNDFNILVKEVNPRTFFETAKLLLGYEEEPSFHSLPYILIMNPFDEVVDFDSTISLFNRKLGTNNFRYVMTEMAHYPLDTSLSYFKKSITRQQIDSMFSYLRFIEKEK